MYPPTNEWEEKPLVCLSFVGTTASTVVSSAYQLFDPSWEYRTQQDVFGVPVHEQNKNLIPNVFILSETQGLLLSMWLQHCHTIFLESLSLVSEALKVKIITIKLRTLQWLVHDIQSQYSTW